MSITCSLSQSQIENLYTNVYVHMRDKGVDFSSEEYMKELFEKISKKKDVDTASKFLQQVPEIIRSIATNRKEIQSFRIKTDSLLDIIDTFKNIDTGLNNVIEYFNPSESLEVKKELINKNANDAFDVEEVSSDKIETADTNYQPYSVYTTSLEEFVTQDPNKKTDFETQDPGKITIFKTLAAIKKDNPTISVQIPNFASGQIFDKPFSMGNQTSKPFNQLDAKVQENIIFMINNNGALPPGNDDTPNLNYNKIQELKMQK